MATTYKIYHNPRCSKSRKTLALLTEHGVEPEVIEYLKTPPTEAELREIVNLLGVSPRDLIRSSEAPYKELGLNDPDVTDETLLTALVDHPRLMQRPIVMAKGRAVIGRPPEAVLEII